MRSRLPLLTAMLLLVIATVAVIRTAAPAPVGAQFPPTPDTRIATPRPPLPPVPPPPSPVLLDRMKVVAEVQEQTAFSAVDLTFRNPTDRPQEATLLFPIPPDVAVSDFTMTIDGQTLEGELLDRDDATRIYTGIVQRQRDPALLEYVGNNLLRARVFPVPPRGESTLTIRFTQLLPLENGAIRYRLPLSAGADVGPRLSEVAITVRVTSAAGVRSVFSPTHALNLSRESETAMVARYEEKNVAPRGMFEVDALVSGGDVGAGLLSYRVPGEDGFFMLWLAPPLRQETVVDKDVILVLDVSGSMAGQKIVQAKAALRFVLNRLNPNDRFNIVAFSSSVDVYGQSLLPASDSGDAIAYVDGLRAEGGTAINDALHTALNLIDPARFTTVLFLTDGEPTVGEQRPQAILDNVRGTTPANARLFVFGVGNDVNTLLLDGLAVQNHGDVTYVRPNQDVEESVSTLYNRISSPQLTDVRVDFAAAGVYDVYPSPLPDLFGGQTLFITGRYRNPVTTTVRLSGQTREGPQSFAFENMRLSDNDRRASHLPRLWAQRKVGYLLREITLRGPERSRELIDEVTVLGRRYGIVTPYTSFLVTEPGTVLPPGGPGPQRTATRTATALAGAPAVSEADQRGALVAATPAPRPAAPVSTGGAGSSAVQMQQVEDHTFVLRNGVWVDTLYQDGTPTTRVLFATDAYLALLREHPELAPFFAIGPRVIVVFDGAAYEVTEE